MDIVYYDLLWQYRFNCVADFSQAANGFNTRSFKRGKFVVCCPFTTGNDGASMAHTFAFRRSHASDLTDNRLGDVIFDIGSRFFFCVTADLTDHHDHFSLRIFLEQFQDIDEV